MSEVGNMPPQCCRWNGKGRCVECSCVRRGVSCTNCTPCHNGRCENYGAAPVCQASVVTPPTNQPEPQPSKEPSPLADASEHVARTTVGSWRVEPGAALDNHIPAKECAMRTLPTCTIPSPPVRLVRQDDSPDSAVVEDHTEMFNSSSLKPVKDLPPFASLVAPNFRWGDIDGIAFTSKVDKAYEEAVHWKRNLFEIPRGKAGTEFVRELSRSLDAYSDSTALEGIALKASMILSALLLQ